MRNTRRSGFTLVELLVAIAIMIALVVLAVTLSPNSEKRHVTDAADQLQTYLASARSRALRDNTLTGVRLLPDANGNFTSFQFVQAPEPYAPTGIGVTLTNAGGVGVATFTAGTNPVPNIANYVITGDLFEFTNGSVHRVQSATANSVTFMSAVSETTVPLSLPPAGNTVATNVNAGFRFIREPRPLMGEQVLQIPNNVAVMAINPPTNVVTLPNGANVPASLNLPIGFSGANDIIFSPSGQVINASSGRIVLCIQSTIGGQGTLLCIYSRTGAVASHPINDANNYATPYTFTQDGRSSGQ